MYLSEHFGRAFWVDPVIMNLEVAHYLLTINLIIHKQIMYQSGQIWRELIR